MNHQLAARSALSLFCAIQGVSTLAIDISRSHATNPSWARHARFHVVWQSALVALLSALEVALIWTPGTAQPRSGQCFYLASLLASLSPLGFLIAFVCRGLFGGTLSDPNGIPSARLKLFGAVRTVDLNLAAVLLALISLLALAAFYRRY